MRGSAMRNLTISYCYRWTRNGYGGVLGVGIMRIC